jgi:hypothetical protein
LSILDFGSAVETQWESEVWRLRSELDKAIEQGFTSLQSRLEGIRLAAEQEWATLPESYFGLGHLYDFGSVWSNRLARAGVGVGRLAFVVAGMKTGAIVGGTLGLEGGPLAIVTAAIGAVIGGIGALAMKPLQRVVGSRFKGKAWVLGKRREQVGERTGPVLDELESAYIMSLNFRFEVIADRLMQDFRKVERETSQADEVAIGWDTLASALSSEVDDLDLATTACILRLDGRERLARGLIGASRNPGVCVLATFDDETFAEAWLFPPESPEVLAVAGASRAGAESAQSLSYVLGLTEELGLLASCTHDAATVTVGAAVSRGLLGAWSDVMSHHLRKGIRVLSTADEEGTSA